LFIPNSWTQWRTFVLRDHVAGTPQCTRGFHDANNPLGLERWVHTWSVHNPNTSFGRKCWPNKTGAGDDLEITANGTTNSTTTRVSARLVPGS